MADDDLERFTVKVRHGDERTVGMIERAMRAQARANALIGVEIAWVVVDKGSHLELGCAFDADAVERHVDKLEHPHLHP